MKLNNKMASWGVGVKERPMVIAGPCSAETPEQVVKTALGLKAIGVNIFRAGIWKPRTRPGSFEGVGSVGLQWMKDVRTETGMLISTEVANVKHVYEVLRAGIDMIWIGARTTANPFAMQEIADALQGVDLPVFVKNPVNPDVDLWIGALERLQKAGLTRIGAIHRGFSSFESSIYRNTPQWQLPIELKRRHPEIPMICDPSHISGKRELLQEVSQKAMDLSFDGLMIESHCNPDLAWSDAKQQISPEVLELLLQNLVIRKENPENAPKHSLEQLRQQIDRIDDEFLDVLHKRMEVSKGIGGYKMENNMTILQPGRWEDILSDCIQKGQRRELSQAFITKLFKAIHQESINKQTEVMNKGKV